jgi:hypothetical protein
MKRLSLVLILLILFPTVVNAATVGVVEGLQMPAWIERNGARQAVTVGLELQVGDRLITGNSARLLLRLNEGSLIKLGGNADFAVDSFLPPPKKEGFFKGVLKVLQGAFRFTTTEFSKRFQRRFDIQIATAVAGIRGTDVWGKATSEKDIICLIEGRVDVRRGEEKPVVLDEPLSFYVAPKNKPALPVGKVSAEQLKKWAAQTELTPGQGVIKRNGRWAVVLKSAKIRLKITGDLENLKQQGYPVEDEAVSVRGTTRYRLVIKNFSSFKEALAFRDRIKTRPEYYDAWIFRK